MMQPDYDPPELVFVWAVVYSNYEPTEVDSLWSTEALARRCMDEKKEHGWNVVRWRVGTE